MTSSEAKVSFAAIIIMTMTKLITMTIKKELLSSSFFIHYLQFIVYSSLFAASRIATSSVVLG